MEREVLMSNPLISYLSTINDENSSGVWGKGLKSKTTENLPEYEVETKTIKHTCAGYSMKLAEEKEVPKKWNFQGSLLAELQIFIYKNCVSLSYCMKEHNEELKYVWLPIS